MPIEIEVYVPDEAQPADKTKIYILNVLKQFLKEGKLFYLQGDIIYNLYERKKSFIQNLFNHSIAEIYIYEDWMCVNVSKKDLAKVNDLFERFMDNEKFVNFCKDIEYKIEIRTEND